MPLSALESYSPLCTEPVDFDRFWNATSRAVAEVPAQPTLARQDAPAPGLHLDVLKFTSLGHETVSGYLLTHDVPEPRPLIIHTHGYNSQFDIMRNWARTGCHVCGIDVRGFGRSAGIPLAAKGWVLTGIEAPQTSIIRGAVADVWQTIEVTRKLLGWRISRTTLTGFSFGGALAIMAAAFDPHANLLVAGQPTFGWHSERLRLSKAGSSAELRHYLENNPDKATEVMDTLRYFDTLHFATRVQKPTVIGAGLDDDVVPSRSVMGIASRLTSAPAELSLLPVSHSDDPRESLWAEFDRQWLEMTVNGVPPDFGSEKRRIREISEASRAA